MSNTHSEVAAFAEGLNAIETNPAATAEFLAKRLAPDFAKWGLADGSGFAKLNLASAVDASLAMKDRAQAVLAEFAAKGAAADDDAAERAFLRFRKAGNSDAQGVADADEGRLLLAFLESAALRKENGWAMLELTAQHLAGKKVVTQAAAQEGAKLKADVGTAQAGAKIEAAGADKEKVAEEEAVKAARSAVDALQEKAAKAAPGSDEAKKAQAELALASAALKGLTDKKAFARAVDASADLDKDVRSNQVLEGLLKFLQELLEKAGFKDSKFLKGQLERVEGKLASHEWGAEMPAGFEKRARSERGFKDSREYLYAQKQAEKFVESQQKLQDCADLVAPASTPAELAALKPAFDRKVRETGFRCAQNLAKFQEAYGAKLALVSKAAPAAAQEAPELPAAKAEASVRAFSTLADGADLNGAGADASGVAFFSFDAASKPSVSADGRKTQLVRFLGTAVAIDVNTKDDVKLLASVTRAKGGNPALDGVRFNEGYLSMADFKKGLTTLFSTGSAHFDFQGGSAVATPVPPAAPSEIPAAGAPSVPHPATAGDAPRAEIPSAPETLSAAPIEYSVEIRDGQIFLLGRDGKIQSAPLSDSQAVKRVRETAEAHENLRKDVEKYRLYDAAYTVWRAKATSVEASMWKWLGMRSAGPEIVRQAIASADEAHAAVTGLMEMAAKKGQPVPDFAAKYLDGAFWPMVSLDGEQSVTTHVFGVENLKAIRETVKNYDGSDYNAALLKVSHAMRDTTLNGGRATGVADVLADQAIATEPKLADLDALFADDAKLEQICSNVKGAEKASFRAKAIELGVPEPLIDGLRKALRKIESNFKAIDEDALKESILKDRPEMDAVALDAAVTSVKNNGPKISMRVALKHALLSDRVQKDRSLAANPLLAEYSDAKGLGGMFDFSDETIGAMSSIGQEIAIQIVMMAASAGVAGVALKGVAMAGTRFSIVAKATGLVAVAAPAAAETANAGKGVMATLRAARSAAALSGVEAANLSGGTLRTVQAFAARAAVQGTAFYETYNALNNSVHKGSGVFDGALDGKEILKSAAMFGVLGGFAKAAQAADAGTVKWFSGLKEMAAAGEASKAVALVVPAGARSAVFMGTVAVEAGLLTSVSQLGEVAWGNDADFTFEEYVQAVLMVSVLRGMGQFDGKRIRIEKDASAQSGLKATVEAPSGLTVHVSMSEITINGTRKALPAPGKEIRYTKEDVRIRGNEDGTYRVTSADNASVLGESVPRAQLRDLLLGRSATGFGEAGMADYLRQRDRAAERRANEGRHDRAASETRRLADEANSGRRAELAGRRAYDAAQSAAAQAPAPRARPGRADHDAAVNAKYDAELARTREWADGANARRARTLAERRAASEAARNAPKPQETVNLRPRPESLEAAQARLDGLAVGERALLGTQSSGNHLAVVRTETGFDVVEFRGGARVAGTEASVDGLTLAPEARGGVVEYTEVVLPGGRVYGNVRDLVLHPAS